MYHLSPPRPPAPPPCTLSLSIDNVIIRPVEQAWSFDSSLFFIPHIHFSTNSCHSPSASSQKYVPSSLPPQWKHEFTPCSTLLWITATFDSLIFHWLSSAPSNPPKSLVSVIVLITSHFSLNLPALASSLILIPKEDPQPYFQSPAWPYDLCSLFL